jgi:hypothetical protein
MTFRYLAVLTVAALLLGLAGQAAAAPAAAWDPFFVGPTTVVSFASLGANPRPYGLAAADFDKDAKLDLVIGRALGTGLLCPGKWRRHFRTLHAVYSWKQAALNVWAVAPADVDADGNMDLVWGATAASSGCSLPVPTGQTCADVGGTAVHP